MTRIIIVESVWIKLVIGPMIFEWQLLCVYILFNFSLNDMGKGIKYSYFIILSRITLHFTHLSLFLTAFLLHFLWLLHWLYSFSHHHLRRSLHRFINCFLLFFLNCFVDLNFLLIIFAFSLSLSLYTLDNKILWF